MGKHVRNAAVTQKARRRGSGAATATTRAGGPSDGGDGIRVLCVDDHAVLVEGLRAQFALDDRIHLVGRLASAEKLLEEVGRLAPDVVLLDIEMPGPDVFEIADRMRHMFPRVRFLFLSAHVRDGYLASAYRCGAWGYFAKGDELEAIVAGIRELARSSEGTFVMGPKVRERSRPSVEPAWSAFHNPARPGGPPSTRMEGLTAREIEILRLIGKGRTRTEIAAELCRSPKTVDGHQERMMKKLGVTTRADLMRYAIREGFAEA